MAAMRGRPSRYSPSLAKVICQRLAAGEKGGPMKRRCWSSDDIGRLRRLVAAGWTDAQIGEQMGRDRDVIGRMRRDLGVAPGRPAGLGAMMARINRRRQEKRERDAETQ